MKSRTPPQSIEAEQSVLGSIIIDNDVFVQVRAVLNTKSFYKEAHRKIWRAFLAIEEDGDAIDLVTVTEKLRTKNTLDSVGSVAYLIGLTDAVPTAAYAENYAKIVAEKYALRRLIEATGEAMRAAYDAQLSTTEIAFGLTQNINDINSELQDSEFTWIGDILPKIHNSIMDKINNKKISGTKTGLRSFDKKFGGLPNGELTVIGGRPAMGKSALITQISSEVAKDKAVMVFSLEMLSEQIGERVVINKSKVDIRREVLSKKDIDKLEAEIANLINLKLFINDASGLDIPSLKAKVLSFADKEDVGLLVVDYMQLIDINDENEVRGIGKITRTLLGIARTLKIPVVGLTQLNRNLENRPDKRPRSSDIRASGRVEEDASLIILMYRDEVYNKDTDKPAILELIVTKNRHGPIGSVEYVWSGKHVAVLEMAQPDRYAQSDIYRGGN